MADERFVDSHPVVKFTVGGKEVGFKIISKNGSVFFLDLVFILIKELYGSVELSSGGLDLAFGVMAVSGFAADAPDSVGLGQENTDHFGWPFGFRGFRVVTTASPVTGLVGLPLSGNFSAEHLIPADGTLG